MIAMALACDPNLLIADEPTTALDASIQMDILDLIMDLVDERNMALIIISHDLGVIARTTTRMAVMYAGRFVETGDTTRLLSAMAHPYSQALYRALPQHPELSDGPAHQRSRLPIIPGSVPSPFSPIEGCAFSNRCRHAETDCFQQQPSLDDIAPAHAVACHHPQGSGPLPEAVH